MSMISVSGSPNLTCVEEYAFKSAEDLSLLNFLSSSSKVVFKENSLYLSSTKKSPTFFFSMILTSESSSHNIFEDNAFGNVDGGLLWKSIEPQMNE